MKKLLILLLSVVFVTACSSSGEEENQKEQVKEEPIITKEDIALAKEMIQYTEELEKDFVTAGNKELKKILKANPDKYKPEVPTTGMDKKEFTQDFMPLSKEKILDPFVEKYGKHIVEKEDTELKARVNVSHVSQEENEGSNGIHKKLDQWQIFPTYQNLTLEEPVIEEHKEHGVHELVFQINEEETVYFNDAGSVRLPDQFTFYKSEEGDLLIGEFPFLKGNEFVSSFKDDTEDVEEALNQLPSLQ